MATGHEPVVGSQTVREALLTNINNDMAELFSRVEILELGGLSGVAVATQEEAEAGTDNTKMMTPLRVRNALAYNAEGFARSAAAETITGAWTFGVAPSVPSPTAAAHPVRKDVFDVHNHDTSYVAIADHTKAAHDALGIDAASLQGKVATDFTQVITSNVTYQVYGSGADFATLTEAFGFLKDKWIPNDVTVTLSIPSGVFDITAETPIAPAHPCLDRIIVAGAGAESSVLQCFGDNTAFLCTIPATFNIQHLKLLGAGSALSNAVAFLLTRGGVINAISVRISGMNTAFFAQFGSKVFTTDCLCISDVSWGYRCYYGGVGSIGFTTNPPAQSINDSWIYAAIGSSVYIQPGILVQLTGAAYGVRSYGARIEAPSVSVSGASSFDFAASAAGLIVNNAGSGSTYPAVNTLSADGSIIIR